MKEEKIFEAIANIDEKYIIEAREENTKVVRPIMRRWISIAACCCVLVIGAIVFININQANTDDTLVGDSASEDTSVDESSSALFNKTVIYDNQEYYTLEDSSEYEQYGLSYPITYDMIGSHAAYLTSNGDISDYKETDMITNIELYTCKVETSKEVYILYDGYSYVPVVKSKD